MRLWDALRRPVWMFDPHEMCGVYANPAALKLWGADSLEELLSRDFSQLSAAARARTQRLAQATAQGDEVSERWTFYPNGRPITVQATISSYWLQDRRPVLLFEASFLEIEAEERRAVEALRHTSTLITLFDEGGQPVFSNPAAFLAYGLAAPRLEARFADPSRAEALRGQASAGAAVAEVCEMVTLGGRRWHHLDVRRVLDPVLGTPGLLLNELDVTLRVEAEQAWAAAEQKAAMAQARQRFLTDMSHELRTPLNAVIGFSGLLGRSGLAPAQQDQASRINEAGKHLLSVVEEMIRLSELDGWTGEQGASPSPEPASEAADVGCTPPLQQGTLRVLYVDDNAHNRALVTAILTSQGIECQTAEDGSQGLEAAKTGGWDLILMDIQMPVMDGVHATRAIRALPRGAGAMPILAVTANTLSNQLEAYREAGMNDCIPKPIDIATLVEKVICWSEPMQAGPPIAEGLAAQG